MFQFFGTDWLDGVQGARQSGMNLIYRSFENRNHVLSISFTAVCRQISALLSTTEIEQESNILSKIIRTIFYLLASSLLMCLTC